MKDKVKLKEIEKFYKQGLDNLLNSEEKLDIDSVIDLLSNLYTTVKVKGVLFEDDEENDMLVFQYGVYDLGDEVGEYFSFDITRQFIKKNEEMYQLSLELIFNSSKFKQLESYTAWSSDFQSLGEWAENIKSTAGYKAAKLEFIKSHRLILDEL